MTNTFDQDFTVHYGAGNVTGNIGSKLLFRGGANVSPFETERSLPDQTGQTSLTSDDDYLRGTKGDRNTYSGSFDYVPTSQVRVLGPHRPLPDRLRRAPASRSRGRDLQINTGSTGPR